MPRELAKTNVDEGGKETHPAFGMMSVSRITSSPGASLFGSSVPHQHYVVVRTHTASRRRDLHHDWVYEEKLVSEVAMSEAQWAALVSSAGGSGAPCTIQWTQRDGNLPRLPLDSRLEVSHGEVRLAAEKAMERVSEAAARYTEKKTAANLRALNSAIANMPSNMEFAAKSLTEHAEKVVQTAKADVEAMVDARARELGIDPSQVVRPAIEAGQ